MDFETVSSKLTGRLDESSWSQVYDFKPEDSEKFRKRGHLFAVISTQAVGGGLDTILTGREVLTRLHEEYFGREIESPLNQLKSAVKVVIDEFSQLGGVEIGTVSLVQDVLYIAVGGGAEVDVLRGDSLSSLLKSSPQEVKSASGLAKDGDIFLIGSSSFFDGFAHSVIKASLDSKDPGRCIEYLAPLVHSREASGSIGLIVVKFIQQKPEDVVDGSLVKIDQDRSIPPTEVLQGESHSMRLGFTKGLLGFVDRIKPNKIYVDKRGDREGVLRKRRVYASIGTMLLLVLVVSVFFGIKQRKDIEFKQTYIDKLSSARHNLEESGNLFSLNPQRSRELFLEAREAVLGLSNEKIEDPEVLELKRRIEEDEGKILSEFKVEPQLHVDLGLLSDEFDGDVISASQEVLYILDIDGKKIIKTSISGKYSEVVAGPAKVGHTPGLSSTLGKIYVVNSEGIFEISEEKRMVLGRDWSGDILTYAYAGNFYILEKENSTIIRYSGDGSNFGKRDNWLSAGVTANLSDAVSWVIDGSIWVLKENGEILKFGLGNLGSFTLSDVPIKDLKPNSIYTNEELTYFYILDKEGARVIVVDKEGKYKAQYLSNQFKYAKGLAVSEKEKNIVFLTGDKLLSVELKHLD